MRMPMLFAGHGSPMNAIENNAFTREWQRIGKALPTPKAILSVSAHWYTAGTLVSDVRENRTIYDMYGFPDALYRVAYPAKGAPALAARTRALLALNASLNGDWGLDHGTWSVLTHLFPKADIPVFQLSVNRRLTAQEHFTLGQALRPLREEGVMILASGNVVHNLALVSWQAEGGFPWADAFDMAIRDAVRQGAFDQAVDYQALGDAARKAVPMMDHYAPLLYALGAADAGEPLAVFNDARVLGSLSMTGYLFG